MFRIRSYCLPCSHSIFDERYSGYLVSSFPSFHTGLSPSMVLLSRRLLVKGLGRTQVQTPHPLMVSHKRSVCPVPFSVALTKGIAIAIFSCGYVRCFNSPRFPSQTSVRDCPKTGSPIRKFRVQRLLAPTPDIKQLATSFIGT